MKKIFKFLAVFSAVTVLFSGCSQSDGGNEKEESSVNSVSPNQKNKGNVGLYGEVVTPADIKKAFDTENSTEIMPLYNVSQDESFNFDFKFDWREVDDLEFNDYITVHTDASCNEESRIYYTPDMNYHDGVSTITVAPMGPVLETESQENNYIYKGKNVWGNAPIYYIAVHYSMETDNPQKLDTPLIIPFTVKREIEAPNVKGVVDEKGCFKLVWDPVEGAEKYIIYHLTNQNLITGENNEPLHGAETGYKDLSMLYYDETTETEFDGFNESGTNITRQNYSVEGDYYVSAVVNGKESGLSAGVSTGGLILPYKPVEGSDILFNRYDDTSEFPLTMDILNIDGSITPRNILYTLKDDRKDLSGNNSGIEYQYTVEGTAITGYVVLNKGAEDMPAEIGSKSRTGNVTPDDNIKRLPDNDVETIIPVDPEEYTPDSENGLVAEQKKNTDEHIKKADDEQIPNIPEGIYVNADSAEEEWLALNMINNNTEISLEAFPSLQDPHTLVDTFYKAYYQNPYIMGVNYFEYDYSTLTFRIQYAYDAETATQKQSELSKKGNETIEKITNGGMSDEDKVKAIYDYLTGNSVYDNEALEYAEENGFESSNLSDFQDSFNTYGVLINGKGVCMSYAYAFRFLCDLSGVESTVVTGYLNGNLPHAWNMAKLDGQWYEIDCTNNAVTTGIPYFLFEADSKLADETGYSKNELFTLDSQLDEYTAPDDAKEYYRANGLFPEDMEQYKKILTENVTGDTRIFAVRWSGDFDESDFIQTIRLAFNEIGLESKLESTQFINQYGFIVILIQ